MKNLTKIYIPFVFGLFLMLSSCSGELNSTNEGGGEEPSANEFVTGEEYVAPTYTNCDCRAVSGTTYQITRSCADCMKANYAANNYQFPSTTSGDIKGFKVAYDELKKIVGEGTNAEVYTMLGIKATDNGSGGQTIESDIFHQVQLPDGAGGFTSTYYDFSSPCPTFCPK